MNEYNSHHQLPLAMGSHVRGTDTVSQTKLMMKTEH